jgi:UDPglucose 6-dehydrogenase
MKITVIGTGYEGLVVGTGLAENGHLVTCVDRSEPRIRALKDGSLPLYEPGLEELVVRNLEEERLFFTTSLAEAVADCLLIFICVGTPSEKTGEADISEVIAAAEDIGRAMTGYRIIVNKSTCPPGTADKLSQTLAALTTHPFDVVVNPGFMKEGAAVDDFLRPDRVIIGCEEVRVQEIMKELYAPFLRTGKPFLSMSLRSAEITKYAVNAMLASRISLMNELTGVCEALGGDISEVREGLAADSRIGSAYLFPGLGFGGSGLPKDLQAIVYAATEAGVPCELMAAIHHVNERQLDRFIQRIVDYYGERLPQCRFALWGASFKPRTDDVRGAPALRIIDRLLASGAAVAVFDPMAESRLRERYGDRIVLVPRGYAALEGADGLIIATEWREFHRPDYDRMGQLMREKVIFDGRNLYTPKVLAEHGFRYFSVGRPAVE